MGDRSEAYNFSRFVDAQRDVYPHALDEIRSGRKRSHWMWFVFPQLAGLGYSPTSQFFAIVSLNEARAYLLDPTVGTRLKECAEALLTIDGKPASEIFGYPDDMKLKSSMTLFALASPSGSIYQEVLDKYFAGERDSETIRLLGSSTNNQ